MRTFAREQNHGISCRSSCNGESEKWRSFYGAPHAMAGLKTSPTLLGDFRTDSRMLVLRANEKRVVGPLAEKENAPYRNCGGRFFAASVRSRVFTQSV